MCQCHELQTAIAECLDLDKPRSLPEELRRKVAVCPHCREFYQSLKASLSAIQSVASNEEIVMSGSLWPTMASRLHNTPMQPITTRFMSRETVDKASRWIAVASVAVVAFVFAISPITNLMSPEPIYQTTQDLFQATPHDVPAPNTTPVNFPFSNSSNGNSMEAGNSLLPFPLGVDETLFLDSSPKSHRTNSKTSTTH